jgi:hypothetical protein
LHGNYFKYPIGGNISYTTSLGLKSKLEREKERNNPKSQTHEIELLLRRTTLEDGGYLLLPTY